MERLLTAVSWIPSGGIFSSLVAGRGGGFLLWIDAVNVLNKEGLLGHGLRQNLVGMGEGCMKFGRLR
jgi:hypothetical protein